MTFLADEKSVHDAQPIELYKFAGPSATFTYYLTSFHDDVSFGGDTYSSVPLMRNELAGASIDVPELEIQLPASQQVVQDYAFGIPPRSLLLTVYRLHTPTGASLVWWQGAVTSFAVEGDRATARSVSVMADALNSEMPGVYYQSLCNHKLYDARCTITDTDHDVATTADVVSGTAITVGSVGGKADQWFKGGEIVRDTDGERRLILDQTGLVLTVNREFRTLNVTDAVTIYAGCDHTVATCKSKFSNVANFGGHPNIIHKSIFVHGLHGV